MQILENNEHELYILVHNTLSSPKIYKLNAIELGYGTRIKPS